MRAPLFCLSVRVKVEKVNKVVHNSCTVHNAIIFFSAMFFCVF